VIFATPEASFAKTGGLADVKALLNFFQTLGCSEIGDACYRVRESGFALQYLGRDRRFNQG
jgi:hypothetical protein